MFFAHQTRTQAASTWDKHSIDTLTIETKIQVESWFTDRSPKDSIGKPIGIGAETGAKDNDYIVSCKIHHLEYVASRRASDGQMYG